MYSRGHIPEYCFFVLVCRNAMLMTNNAKETNKSTSGNAKVVDEAERWRLQTLTQKGEQAALPIYSPETGSANTSLGHLISREERICCDGSTCERLAQDLRSVATLRASQGHNSEWVLDVYTCALHGVCHFLAPSHASNLNLEATRMNTKSVSFYDFNSTFNFQPTY
jgi:hypothetical protein